MPLYSHLCPKHGEFDDFRPVAQAGQAVPCPVCGKPSKQVFSAEGRTMLVTNPALIGPKGLPRTSLGVDYLEACKKDELNRERYHPLERRAERLAKKEHDTAVKQGRKAKRIQVGGGRA